MRILLIAFAAMLVFTTCRKEKKERKKIEEYVASHQLNGQFTGSGLYYTIDVEGTGGNPLPSSTVTVEYTGYFLDGKKFDGTESGKPIDFGLDQVIQGWTEGIPKFKKGGKGKLIIPSSLAYGRQGQGSVPGNSILVFDIYLVDWK